MTTKKKRTCNHCGHDKFKVVPPSPQLMKVFKPLDFCKKCGKFKPPIVEHKAV